VLQTVVGAGLQGFPRCIAGRREDREDTEGPEGEEGRREERDSA
jgi:hypothetical protein